MSKYFFLAVILFGEMSFGSFASFEEYTPQDRTSLLLELYLEPESGKAANEKRKILALDQVTKKVYTLALKREKNNRYSSIIDLSEKKFEKIPTFVFATDEKFSAKLIVLPIAQKKSQKIALFDEEIKAMNFADDTANKVQLKESEVQEWLRRRSQMIERNRMESESNFVLHREKLKKEFESLTAGKKTQHQAEAVKLAQQGEAAYRAEKYSESVNLFRKSVERDPFKDRIYYKYGVALYKTDDFVKSLAALSVAEGDIENKAEYYYYIGLNNMKLRDFEKSYDSFRIARDENDQSISPMAAFLAGNIAFQSQKYDNAKEDFQFCLDNSKDVAMDKQAEAMLEQIDQAEAFLALQKQVFRYSVFLGYSYDQNILNISQQGAATETAGYRWSYGLTGYYKIRQTTKTELGLQASYTDTYSVDKSGQSSTVLQAADPLLFNVGLPYRRAFEAFDKQMMWSISPSLTTVTMNAEGTGRKQILESRTLDTDLMYQVNPKVISAYRLQYNSDTSSLSTTGSDNDQGGIRVTLGTNQSYLLDSAGSQRLAGDFSIIRNTAKGRNNVYDKNAISGTYSFPMPAAISGSFKAEFMTSAYKLNANDRTDSVWTFTVNGSRTFYDAWTANFNTQFMNSKSSLDSNKYDKYVFAFTLTYAGSVSKK